MDMMCRCEGKWYTCVACRVKRGDYMDWAEKKPPYIPRPKARCSVPACERISQTRGLCYLHYERQRVREKAKAL